MGEDTAGKGDYATKPRGWKGTDNPWMADAKPESMYTYVNLLKNPERYTGYAALSSSRFSLPTPHKIC